MKPFDDLTQQELIALTEDKINYYVDLRCAEKGVRLLPPLPTEPENPNVEPDLEAWEVDHINLHFLRKSDAEKAQALLMDSPMVDESYTGLSIKKASNREYTSFTLMLRIRNRKVELEALLAQRLEMIHSGNINDMVQGMFPVSIEGPGRVNRG